MCVYVYISVSSWLRFEPLRFFSISFQSRFFFAMRNSHVPVKNPLHFLRCSKVPYVTGAFKSGAFVFLFLYCIMRLQLNNNNARIAIPVDADGDLHLGRPCIQFHVVLAVSTGSRPISHVRHAIELLTPRCMHSMPKPTSHRDGIVASDDIVSDDART